MEINLIHKWLIDQVWVAMIDVVDMVIDMVNKSD